MTAAEVMAGKEELASHAAWEALRQKAWDVLRQKVEEEWSRRITASRSPSLEGRSQDETAGLVPLTPSRSKADEPVPFVPNKFGEHG